MLMGNQQLLFMSMAQRVGLTYKKLKLHKQVLHLLLRQLVELLQLFVQIIKPILLLDQELFVLVMQEVHQVQRP
jgi:hypothetical protein